MNRAEQPAILVPIPDVQSGRDERRIAIDQVGIKGLRYPLPFMDRDGVARTTIATCNVYVALPEDRKGTHMSRLVALLEERAAPGAVPLTVAVPLLTAVWPDPAWRAPARPADACAHGSCPTRRRSRRVL